MKRLALICVVALVLASAVFAPVAIAQKPSEPAISFSPDGELLVALIDRDSVFTAKTWIDWKDIPLTAVAFSPDGELLVAFPVDQRHSGKDAVAFSPDGKLL